MPSKAQLSRDFVAPARVPRKKRLWALMQVHQYGQSIIGEVFAPNKLTAQSIFLAHYKYLSVRNGRFFIGELWYPGGNVKGTYLEYTLDMGPRQIRSVKAIVHASGPSPFPVNPRKPVERTQYTRPPINTQKRTGGLYNPDATPPKQFQTTPKRPPTIPVTKSVTIPRRPALPPRRS